MHEALASCAPGMRAPAQSGGGSPEEPDLQRCSRAAGAAASPCERQAVPVAAANIA